MTSWGRCRNEIQESGFVIAAVRVYLLWPSSVNALPAGSESAAVVQMAAFQNDRTAAPGRFETFAAYPVLHTTKRFPESQSNRVLHKTDNFPVGLEIRLPTSECK
jgi:hypothetical protein